jgi:signal transduction histidine kinase
MKPVSEISALTVGWFDRLKSLPPWLFLVATLAFAFTLVFVVVSETNHARILESWKTLRESRDQADLVDEMRTLLLNAETGQRGYLLTGNDAYLAPLTEAKRALPELQKRVALGFMSRPDRQKQIDHLSALMLEKMVELAATVGLATAGKRDEALAIVAQNTGEKAMADARTEFSKILLDMTNDAAEFRAKMFRDLRISRYAMIAIALLNLALLASAIYIFSNDVRRRKFENARLSSVVADRTEELNELSSHLQVSGEHERASLARDLHDELGGILTSAKMDLNWLSERVHVIPGGEERVREYSKLLDEAVGVKRRVIENLRPSLLDNLGLPAALEWYVGETCKKAGLKCTLNLAEDIGLISSDASIALFRIVQESTTNVLRHANAKTMTAHLHVDERNIYLSLQDDGAGLPAEFNPAKLSHGLSGIRQRAKALGGDAIWESLPGKGTTVTVTIPRDVNSSPPINYDE